MRLIYQKSTAWMWSVGIDSYLEMCRFDRDGWAEDIKAAKSIQKRLIDDHETIELTPQEERILKSVYDMVHRSELVWAFQKEDMREALED